MPGWLRQIRNGPVADVIRAVLRQVFHYCDEYYRIMSMPIHQPPGVWGGGHHGV